MPIVAPLPNTISAGQLADAAPVMSNFQWIVDQVNANAQAGATTNTMVLLRWAAGQTVTSNFAYVLGYAFTPQIIYDALGEFDTVLGTFTAQNDGNYLLQAYVRLSSTMTGISFLGLGPIVFYKNHPPGTVIVGEGGLYANGYGTTTDLRAYGSTVVNLLAGETIDTYFFSPTYSGGALSTAVYAGALNTQYSISRIS